MTLHYAYVSPLVGWLVGFWIGWTVAWFLSEAILFSGLFALLLRHNWKWQLLPCTLPSSSNQVQLTNRVFITYPLRCTYMADTQLSVTYILSVGISLRWNRIRSKSYRLYRHLDLRNYYESEWTRRVSTCLKQRFPLYWHPWAKSSLFTLYKRNQDKCTYTEKCL